MTKIERIVLSVIEDLTDRELCESDLDLDLTLDLKITSDDLSFVFVPNLQSDLGIEVDAREWRKVHSGRDAAVLLEDCVMQQSAAHD